MDWLDYGPLVSKDKACNVTAASTLESAGSKVKERMQSEFTPSSRERTVRQLSGCCWAC